MAYIHSGGKSSNKIIEIVRLQQMLKKWKKSAAAASGKRGGPSKGGGGGGGGSGRGFLKRTLSTFSDSDSSDGGVPPKGFLAVSVGEDLRRFVIPMEYLSHGAFESLLKKAEDEFSFQQEGVLRIPCEVSVFENILEGLQDQEKESKDKKKKTTKKDKKKDGFFYHYESEPSCGTSSTHKPLLCR